MVFQLFPPHLCRNRQLHEIPNQRHHITDHHIHKKATSIPLEIPYICQSVCCSFTIGNHGIPQAQSFPYKSLYSPRRLRSFTIRTANHSLFTVGKLFAPLLFATQQTTAYYRSKCSLISHCILPKDFAPSSLGLQVTAYL